ncbi:hypothetical protein [Acaryochloris sp. IP29b_bin.137]|uniref:hypothetical protein n=1 Tax=Acaryochloris sp. IP29b_bin.137 TaxID=2969217 RepID=UPI002629D733|nr:hypothetical protein [Acaryochloris sp. IP29b_bin.137]
MAIGGVLPDAPMFVFYFVEKVLRGSSEQYIWRQAYYQTHWQNFIDVFNSLPIIAFGFLIALWAESRIGILLFASMTLHVLGDLPLHHDDGHRHFFPFSNWRFESPISYWDPNHYGGLFTRVEILAVLISCFVLFRRYKSLKGRMALGVIGGLYGAYFVYAFTMWS